MFTNFFVKKILYSTFIFIEVLTFGTLTNLMRKLNASEFHSSLLQDHYNAYLHKLKLGPITGTEIINK